jgi:DNA-binding transcriptional ArsR family regulator
VATRGAYVADRAKKKTKKELPLKERLLKGLSHALRTKILAYMNDRAWSPRELQRELGEGLSQVSYHVKVLHDYDLIELTHTEPRRGAVEHFYRAVERAFVPSGMAKHIPKSGQHIIGNDILQEIDKDVAVSLKSGRFYKRDDWHTSWTPLDFDGQACEDAEEFADEVVERFLKFGAEAATRRANGEGDGEHIPTSVALLIFGSERGEEKQPSSKKKPRARKKRK